MPAYHGGKQRHGPAIRDAIVSYERRMGHRPMPLLVPFVGMAGVARCFARAGDRKIVVSDTNPDIIALLRAARNPSHRFPTTCDRQEFDRLKRTRRVSAKKGFVGIACSFNGNYFRGFRNPSTQTRDYIGETRRALRRLGSALRGVTIADACSYDAFEPRGMTVYADPPYRGNNIQSQYFQGFDHQAFWDTMRRWSKHNLVFVSEFQAPADWTSVWSGPTYSNTTYTNEKRTDHLFVLA